jgi:hypothetical protein
MPGRVSATDGGWAFRGAHFKRQIAKTLDRLPPAKGAASQGQGGPTATNSTPTPITFDH